MAAITSGNHCVEIGFSHTDKYEIISYYIRRFWNNKNFFNYLIVAIDTGTNIATLSMDAGEDWLISFLSDYLKSTPI